MLKIPEITVLFADEEKVYEGIQYALCYSKYSSWEDKDTLVLSDDNKILGYIYPGKLSLQGTDLFKLLIAKNGFKNLLKR